MNLIEKDTDNQTHFSDALDSLSISRWYKMQDSNDGWLEEQRRNISPSDFYRKIMNEPMPETPEEEARRIQRRKKAGHEFNR